MCLPSSHSHVPTILFLTAFLAVPAGLSAYAAEAPRVETRAADETADEKTLEKINTLVLPQQKQWAVELIEKDPDSEEAKLARRLLAEYKRYDELQAEQQREREAATRAIREYWEARQCTVLQPTQRPLTITNLTEEPVLYQIRGPGMAWAGPHRLRGGDSHKFHYPVVYRRVTQTGIVQYSLSVGSRCVFRVPKAADATRLFEVRE